MVRVPLLRVAELAEDAEQGRGEAVRRVTQSIWDSVGREMALQGKLGMDQGEAARLLAAPESKASTAQGRLVETHSDSEADTDSDADTDTDSGADSYRLIFCLVRPVPVG